MMDNRIRLAVLIVAVMALLGVSQPAVARTVKIVVIPDGPTGDVELVDDIQKELRRLVDDDVELIFDRDPRYDLAWTSERGGAVLSEALSSDADIILGAGPNITRIAWAPDVPLVKPFVSTHVFSRDLSIVPVKDGKITRPNLNIMVFEHTTIRDIDILRRVVDFDSLYIGFANESALGSYIVQWGEEMGVPLVPVNLVGDIEQTVAQLPDDVEAFALAEMQRVSREDRRRLIDALNERGIPTFSFLGHADVELGALAAVLPDYRRQRVRRVALNISRLIRGESIDDLPVFLSVEARLLINGATAAKVGYEPSLEIRNMAAFINENEMIRGSKLAFVNALQIAEKNNINLVAADAEVETALRQKQRARSPMLPQIETAAAFQKNEVPIEASIFPKEVTVGSVRVNQIIYDDRIMTGFRSSGRFHEGAGYEREAERLDVLAAAGEAYLRYVLAGVLRSVSVDNVRLTEDNLELSRTRFAAGYSGRDEVLRWESILASRRSELLRRDATVETARIALNQVLGVAQDSEWRAEETKIDLDQQQFWLGEIGPIRGNEDRLQRLTEVFVQVAVDSAPELKALDLAADAFDILASERARSFILPRFVASLSYDYFFDWSPAPPPGTRDHNYTVEIAAVYPLFSGGDKYYDRRLQQSQRDAVLAQREFVRQRIEQRMRTAVRNTAASFPIIRLSQTAAENARQNLDIVQDQYSQGVVNVTDLLSAQNDAFIADQNAEAAVYTFLLDLVDVQRALTFFEVEKSEEEKRVFFSYIASSMGE